MVKREHHDSPWGTGRGPLPFQMGLCMFGLLSLELALIRWTGGQIRIIAYFSNMVLITAFLGMGLGIALGQTRPNLIHFLLPVLAVLSAVLCFSDQLNLMKMTFPDPAISLWGVEGEINAWGFVSATLVIVACFGMIGTVFLLAGIPAGWLFRHMPPLSAYSADLIGSLLGVLSASMVAAFDCGPGVWLALGVVPFLWITRKPLSLVAGVTVVTLGMISSGDAIFSPYNRIDVEQSAQHHQNYDISVNRDFHQQALDLSDTHLTLEPADAELYYARQVYDLPFMLKGVGGRALVVGAGTGNDVAAALRQGFSYVESVDIDSRLIELGRKLHPERPYANPGVHPVVNDARSYLATNTERFDVVCYGLLDSHAMFSAMSTLRLDNYVYTLEGLRQGWAHVKDDGLLSVSFCMYAGEWMATRFYNMIKNATGLDPVVVNHGYYGMTFLVSRNADFSRINPILMNNPVNLTLPGIKVPTDDWPYLYLRPGVFPTVYVTILSLLLLATVIAVRRVYGQEILHFRKFDMPLFFMGAAFMLLETRLVTSLSLLFGSTWIVNSAVIAGVLVMVLLANFYVTLRPPEKLLPWYAMLAVSLLFTTCVTPALLNSLSFLSRFVVAGLLYSLPVGFAGVIFSTRFREAENPSFALGANLIGAVVGGCLEYLSIYFGLQAMGWLALVLYGLSYFSILYRRHLRHISFTEGTL
jgi:hypothetical protein